MDGCGTFWPRGRSRWHCTVPSNLKATPCATVDRCTAGLEEWSLGSTAKGLWCREMETGPAILPTRVLSSTRLPLPATSGKWTLRESTTLICTGPTAGSVLSPQPVAMKMEWTCAPEGTEPHASETRKRPLGLFSPGCGEFGGIVCCGEYPLGS